MKRLFLRILLVLILLFSLFVLKTVYQAGYFKTITNHFEGNIQKIEGVVGCEDITIDQETGLALISSTDRRDSTKKGNIFLLNLNDTNPKPINLTENLSLQDFHPHGISFLNLADGRKQLYVVNHRKNKVDAVEIFDFTDSTLIFKESIDSEKVSLIVSPNDIVAVGERQFYLTNDHNEEFSSKRSLKDLLRIATGNILYFDGQKATILAKNLLYANGINVSLDKKKLFVAEASNQKIIVYDRDTQTGDLKETDQIMIDGPDNIELDVRGNLWVGCHPKLLAFLGHAKKSENKSPSQVMMISYKPNNQSVIQEKLMDDGTKLSASSVGAVYKNRLLVGPVFDEKILLGDMK